MSDNSLTIGMLVFPRMTQLDLTGPFEAFARIPGAKVHLLWKRKELVTSDTGLSLLPTMTFAECPPLDVICVPGGPGQIALMDDGEVLTFVRKQGQQAQYVTSVCTGSLVLGAAELLNGYEATTHWMSMDQLEVFGTKPVKKRIVRDRNRITGGGVTAGLDFALYLASILVGEQTARMIQLSIEYNPDPPFTSGSPDSAPSEIVSAARTRAAQMLETRRAASLRAAERLKRETLR